MIEPPPVRRPGGGRTTHLRIAGAVLLAGLCSERPAEAARRLPAARVVLAHPDGTEETVLAEDLRFVYYRRRLIRKGTRYRPEEGGRSRTEVLTRAADDRKESRNFRWEEERRTRMKKLREVRFEYRKEDGNRRLVLVLTRWNGKSFRRDAMALTAAFHPLGLHLAGRVEGVDRDFSFPPLFGNGPPPDGPVLKSLRFLERKELP